MPIGDPISQPIPPVGTAGTSYASQLVEFLQEVKARLESKVALTALLAGLFDLANNGIANAKYVQLYEQVAAPTTPVGSLQRYGGELYYVSPSGAVRITSGGQLDVVAANGISGDYAAPAEFRYDLAALAYFAYSNFTAAPKEWARVAAQGFDVYGTLTSTTRVRIAWGGGASYTLTLPAAVPATTVLVRMDNAGGLQLSGNIDEDVTLAANRHMAISGTAKYKHGNKIIRIPCLAQSANVAAGAGPSTTAGVPGAVQPAGSASFYPLYGLPADLTISKITVHAASNPAGVTYEIFRVDNFGPTFTTTGISAAGSVVSPDTDVVGTIAASQTPLWVKVTTTANPTTITHFTITYSVA